VVGPSPNFSPARPEALEEIRSIAEEQRVAFKEALALAASPRVVDLSHFKQGSAWQPAARKPESQYAAQQAAVERLTKRVSILRDRMSVAVPLVVIGA